MENQKLINLCNLYPVLIRRRQKKLSEIQDPKRRIMSAVTLANMRIERLFLEEELCKKITLDLDYAVKD